MSKIIKDVIIYRIMDVWTSGTDEMTAPKQVAKAQRDSSDRE